MGFQSNLTKTVYQIRILKYLKFTVQIFISKYLFFFKVCDIRQISGIFEIWRISISIIFLLVFPLVAGLL